MSSRLIRFWFSYMINLLKIIKIIKKIFIPGNLWSPIEMDSYHSLELLGHILQIPKCALLPDVSTSQAYLHLHEWSPQCIFSSLGQASTHSCLWWAFFPAPIDTWSDTAVDVTIHMLPSPNRVSSQGLGQWTRSSEGVCILRGTLGWWPPVRWSGSASRSQQWSSPRLE